MKDNDFDKAGRACLHLDPPGMLRWLMPKLSSACSFQRWADTRTIAFPGEPDRTLDTVAEVREAGLLLRWWLVVVELQSALNDEIFGRLLEYLGRLWRDLRPQHPPHQRYGVAAALINFTGKGKNSQDYRVPGTNARCCLRIEERNLAEFNAERTLRRIASGEWTRAILPFVPLMKGGAKERIIARWKQIAEGEPDGWRRDYYAGMALVFSDLTGCRPVWKRELEGWNVKRSEQVLEWQAEARVETRVEDILKVLRLRFGPDLPSEVEQHIRATMDGEKLDRWLEAAVKARTLNKFRQAMET